MRARFRLFHEPIQPTEGIRRQEGKAEGKKRIPAYCRQSRVHQESIGESTLGGENKEQILSEIKYSRGPAMRFGTSQEEERWRGGGRRKFLLCRRDMVELLRFGGSKVGRLAVDLRTVAGLRHAAGARSAQRQRSLRSRRPTAPVGRVGASSQSWRSGLQLLTSAEGKLQRRPATTSQASRVLPSPKFPHC